MKIKKNIYIFTIYFFALPYIYGNEERILTEIISKNLSYPKSELRFYDFTKYEQKFFKDDIYKSFIIESAVTSSFRPILVTIAKRGTLLTKQQEEFLNSGAKNKDLSARKNIVYQKIFNNITSLISWDQISYRANYSGKDFGTNTINSMALFCIFSPLNSNIEIRIAVLEHYIENQVPGGEKYYEYFRSVHTADEIYGDASGPPEFDFKKFFADFGRAIVESEMVKQIISENSNPNANRISTTSQINNSPTPVQNPVNRTTLSEEMADAEEQNKSINFVLLLAGIAALLLAVLYIFKKTKFKH